MTFQNGSLNLFGQSEDKRSVKPFERADGYLNLTCSKFQIMCFNK